MSEALRTGCPQGGRWHREWQGRFPKEWHMEVPHQTSDGRWRKADLILPGTPLVVEVQHSRISKSVVAGRNDDYATLGKRVLWLLDGSETGLRVECRRLEEGDHLLVFGRPESFSAFQNVGCDALLVDVGGDRVFAVRPEEVRRGCVRCSDPFTVEEVLLFASENFERFKPPPRLQHKFYVFQDPPGSGKTYRLVRRCLAPWTVENHGHDFSHYNTFFFCAKPHSAKEVIYAEFRAQLKRLEQAGEIDVIKHSEQQKAYKCTFRRTRDDCLVETFFATVDSFVWALGSKNERRSLHSNPFVRICDNLAFDGPSAVNLFNGSVNFKGQCTSISARTLICWDEATKLEIRYLRALLRIILECNADAAVSGDLLQSIEVEHNSFERAQQENLSALLNGAAEPVIVRGNKIRRFGRKLVDELNEVTPWTKYGVAVPQPADDIEHEEGSFYVQSICRVSVGDDSQAKSIKKAVTVVFEAFKADVRTLALLPHEVLLVFPHVSINPVGDELCDRIHEFWIEELMKEEYQARVSTRVEGREYLRDYLARPDRRMAYFHRSEGNQPVNTSLSRNCTRMVSIHASQGDGRRLVLVVGLSESKLSVFSDGSTNSLVYDSLLTVALSRAKARLRIFIEQVYDRVWKLFEAKLPDVERREILPVIRKHNVLDVHRMELALANDWEKLRFKAEEFLLSAAPDGNLSDASRGLVEYEHHVIRAAAYHCVFFVNIVTYELASRKDGVKRQMNKLRGDIAKLPVEVFEKAGEYYKALNGEKEEKEDGTYWNLKCIPLLKDRRCVFGSFERVKDGIKKLKIWLRDLTDGADNSLLKDPNMCVLLYHLIDIYRNRRYATSRLSTVIAVFEDENDLERHHAWLANAEACYRSVVGECQGADIFEWKISHPLRLASPLDSKVRSIGKLVLEFRAQFLAVSDTRAIFFMLVPRVDDLTVVTFAGKVLLATLLMQNPVERRSAELLRNAAAGRRLLQVCIVACESSSPLLLDATELLREHRRDLAEWVGSCATEQCKRYKETIEDFLLHCGTPGKALEVLPEPLKTPFYVGRAIERLSEDEPITRDGPSQKRFRDILEEEREKAVKNLRREVEHEVQHVDLKRKRSSSDEDDE